MIAFTSLLAHPDRSPRERIGPAALALLPYPSGTTGLAKGVMLSHRACLTSVVQMLTAAPVARTGRILAVASFFHAVGLVVLAGRPLFGGAILVRLPRFEVTGLLAALQDHRITQTVVVPPIVQALAKHPRGPALNSTGMTICPDAAPPAWRRLVRRGRGWSARLARG
jgi:acyl-CoA synthetase (AMP-forming)/AMP-acid ligase II